MLGASKLIDAITMAAVVSNSVTQEQAEMMVEEKETADLKMCSSTSIAGYGGITFEKHQGFWVGTRFMRAVKLIQMEFQPRPHDIYLASPLKSGTTWIKALVHTILAVKLPAGDAQSIEIPRATVDAKNPHDLVHTIDTIPFSHIKQYDLSAIFSGIPSPRLLHTHLPFDLLPPLVKTCPVDCKIVYVARNPRDVFVSWWKFLNKLHENGSLHLIGDVSKETAFDAFCSGLFHGGPFAETVLSYWRESRRNPNQVMFLTYEELQADCMACVKKLGAFLGCSPTLLEEHAPRIVDKCSFDRLSSLEVNTRGKLENRNVFSSCSAYFREGKVGEWKKHFTAEMEDRIHREIEQKFNDEGLLFTYS